MYLRSDHVVADEGPLRLRPRTCGVCVRRSPAFIRVQNVPQLRGSLFMGVRTSSPVFAVRGSPFGSPKGRCLAYSSEGAWAHRYSRTYGRAKSTQLWRTG
jgi:hypothetical protein